MKFPIQKQKLLAVVLVALTQYGCKQSDIIKPSTEKQAAQLPQTALASSMLLSTVYAERNLTFARANAAYSSTEATDDFGNIEIGWNATRAATYNNALRILLVANQTTGGGLVNRIDVEDGSEYVVEYKVKFGTNFHFKTQGKLGFGLLIGEGNTGCDPATDGLGGSLRTMWATKGTDTVFTPYIYFADQTTGCGSSFGKRYPATGSIVKNTWYTIKLYAKSNTGTSANGHVKMLVDGNIILDQAIRWTTDDTRRLINKVSFSTFRGGGDAASPSNGYIYYDSVYWKQLTP